jgi:hypothetical protein
MIFEVANEEDFIEVGTLCDGAQHPGPSGMGSKQLLDTLRDERGDANRELAAGFSVVWAVVVAPLEGGGSR